jgi:hypothetical protein
MKRGKRDQEWFLLGEGDLMSTFMVQQYNISLVHSEFKTILKLHLTLSSEFFFRSSFKVNLLQLWLIILIDIVIFDAYFQYSNFFNLDNCHLFKGKLFQLST